MVDNLAIAISHALLALAIWRLAHSPAIDADPGTELADKVSRRKLADRLNGETRAAHGPVSGPVSGSVSGPVSRPVRKTPHG